MAKDSEDIKFIIDDFYPLKSILNSALMAKTSNQNGTIVIEEYPELYFIHYHTDNSKICIPMDEIDTYLRFRGHTVVPVVTGKKYESGRIDYHFKIIP